MSSQPIRVVIQDELARQPLLEEDFNLPFDFVATFCVMAMILVKVVVLAPIPLLGRQFYFLGPPFCQIMLKMHEYVSNEHI